MEIPLKELLDIETNKYEKAITAIRRVEQIANSDAMDEIKKSGLKLSVVALAQVLTDKVKIIGKDISHEEYEAILAKQEKERKAIEQQAALEETQTVEEEEEEIPPEKDQEVIDEDDQEVEEIIKMADSQAEMVEDSVEEETNEESDEEE